MKRIFRPIIANKVSNSSFYFMLNSIDFEVSLYDKFGLIYSVNKNQFSVTSAPNPVRLSVLRRYVLRYNNNDGNVGFITADLYQITPHNNKQIMLQSFSHGAIHGPTVFEIPFYITYTNPKNKNNAIQAIVKTRS